MTPSHADGATRLLVLDEEQRMLADAARDLLAAEAPVSRARALRDAGEVWDASLWTHLTDLGWAGLMVPESHGGMGLGLPEAVAFMEAVGAHLAATPMVSALMVGPLAPHLGTAAGTRVSLAWQEDARTPRPATLETRYAEGRVTGRKVLVLDGTHAERFVVSARDSAGTAVLVAVDAADTHLEPLTRVDHRDAAHVVCSDAPAELLSGGLPELEAAVDRGTVALAAELLGLSEAARTRTLDYLRTREQFGRPIGSFQALQHRAVDAFIATELARSGVLAAAFEPSPRATSLAKAQATDAAQRVAEEGVQMHGGIGMTDEHDVGLYLKRIWVAAMSHGDASWHRSRWARLGGY